MATVVHGQHDITLNADNEARDILLMFLTNPERCTEAYDRWIATSEAYEASVTKKAEHKADGSDILHVELSQPHGIHPFVPYVSYLEQARRWARKHKAQMSSSLLDASLETALEKGENENWPEKADPE